jgi:hypothetical protein
VSEPDRVAQLGWPALVVTDRRRLYDVCNTYSEKEHLGGSRLGWVAMWSVTVPS